jgi:hypothetical protein
MLINKNLPAIEFRHNYIRLIFLVGTFLLFIGYVAVAQLFERGNSRRFCLNLIKRFYYLIF